MSKELINPDNPTMLKIGYMPNGRLRLGGCDHKFEKVETEDSKYIRQRCRKCSATIITERR